MWVICWICKFTWKFRLVMFNLYQEYALVEYAPPYSLIENGLLPQDYMVLYITQNSIISNLPPWEPEISLTLYHLCIAACIWFSWLCIALGHQWPLILMLMSGQHSLDTGILILCSHIIKANPNCNLRNLELHIDWNSYCQSVYTK